MASDNNVSLVGNLTDDPELRFTPSGRQVANFTVAVNRRFKNQSGQWEDKLDGFFRCNCWGELAENVAESLTKGTRVVVVGRLQQRSWEDQDGNKRSATDVVVDEIGPSLKWGTATVQKTQRSGGQAARGGSSSAADADWGDPSPVTAPAGAPAGPADEGGF